MCSIDSRILEFCGNSQINLWSQLFNLKHKIDRSLALALGHQSLFPANPVGWCLLKQAESFFIPQLVVGGLQTSHKVL